MADYGPFYTPPSVAPILQNASAQQLALMQQPKGFAAALPAIGDLVNKGVDVAGQQQKKQSVMAAQQAYSQYLAKVDAGTATPEDHQTGYMAAMSLGIDPAEPLGLISFSGSAPQRRNQSWLSHRERGRDCLSR